ncbi:MAG: hypothetical protein BGO43_13545 [Gammaproteobacteria bacterium 39-13]|nr:hypothetical protein [Gammaproteobacteria bacterium]OJV94770.1 MAG: hypothetical protein BGO43_13545 [Gammaproteobacteria bacterium 39-13]
MKDANKKIELLVLICFTSIYTTQALAINASTAMPVQDIVTFLKEVIIQNLAYVAAFCAFIIAAIAAVGNKIGPIIVDNVGKIVYFAFGGVVLSYLLSAAGATLG